MKYLNYKLILLFLLAVSLTVMSCKKEEDDPAPTNNNPNPNDTTATKKLDPTFTFTSEATPNGAELKPNEKINIAFIAEKGKDGVNLDEFLIEYKSTGGAYAPIQGYPLKNLNIEKYPRNLPFTAQNVDNGTESFRLTIKDKAGKTAVAIREFTVKRNSGTDPAPTVHSNIMLSNSMAFFSTTNGMRYNEADAKNNVGLMDVTYFYSGTSGNNLASPTARANTTLYGDFTMSWGQLNMEYRTTSLTAEQFNAINTSSAVTAAYTAGTPSEVTGGNPSGTRITGVAAGGKGGQFKAGSVVAFRSSLGNRRGLLLINSVAADANGSASLTFKIAK